MRLTMKDKLKMVDLHLKKGLSLSHVSEMYGNYHTTALKYIIKLYKRHGKAPFMERGLRIYKRDTKLLAIGQVLAGESIRSVACELGLVDPAILRDWVKKYRSEGEAAIQDTRPRANYLLKEERFKEVVDKKVAAENERLRAEIAFLKKSQSLVQKLEGATVRDKVRIVTELRTEFSLKTLLGVAKLASSVYYYTLTAMKTTTNAYAAISAEIERLYIKIHKKRCGYHQIYHHLKQDGWTIGKNKVLEIMRAKGFTKQKAIKWRRYNAYAGNVGQRAPNVLNQAFQTTHPYEKAGTDVTEFPLRGTSVYLAPVVDFHTREILAYEVGLDAKVERILQMLAAMKKRHGAHLKGMIIQSDQGVQYQNSRYIERLKRYGIIQSMSRKGNCLDNSPTENLFGRIKQEIWDGHEDEYDSVESLITTIHEYVKYYNHDRIVMKTRMTPIACRNNYLSSVQ